MWQFDLDSLINPNTPLGSSEGGTMPYADVPVNIYAGSHGGSFATPDLQMLKLCHSIQCRVLREIEHSLDGDRHIAERLSDAGVGCTGEVLRKSIKAIAKISDVAAGAFDLRLRKYLTRIQTTGGLAGVRDKQLRVLRVLHRANQDAYRMSNSENAFRRTNVVPRKSPGPARLHETFLPAFASKPQIATPSVDNMLTIAIFGLVNPAGMYRNFDYLHVPFASATAFGSLAVYERRPNEDMMRWIRQARASAAKRRVPTNIKGNGLHERLFLDCCVRVEAAWQARSQRASAEKML